MGLKVWLPLTGTLENKGISDLQFSNENTTNITTDTNGKIGSCYKKATKSTAGRIISNNTLTLSNDLSMCCWAKVTETTSDTANGLITNHNHSTNTGFGITVKQISTTDYRISCNTGNGSSRTYMTYYGTSNIKNNWHHLALTYDNTKHEFKLWVDGISEVTQSYTNAAAANKIMIFAWSVNNTNTAYYPACMLNDVRIYDHCLSAAEVKEISQGLVLHYKLDSFQGGYGNPNLITNFDTSFLSYADGATTLFTNQMNSGTQEIVSNFAGAGKCLHLHSNGGNNRQYRTFSATTGKTYTVSADYYSTTTQDTAWRGELNGGDYSWAGASGGAYTTPGIWKRMSYTYSNLTSNATIYFFTYCANGTDCYIKNIKIEEGSSATTWGPPGSSTTIIQDSSGYGHNGTITGNLTINSNSGRHSSCIYTSSGDTNYITTPTLQLPGDAITMNFWFKSSNKSPGSSYHMPFEGTASSNQSYEMSIHQNGYLRGGLVVAGSRKVDNCTSTKLTDGNWHMCTMTYNGSIIKRYVDGVMEKSTSVTGTLVASSSFVLGHYGSNTSYCSKEAYTSDVRLYVTALSDADILSLYNTAAKVDNLHNMHTFEYIEDSSHIKLTKQGQFKEGEIQEDITTKFYKTNNIIKAKNFIEF